MKKNRRGIQKSTSKDMILNYLPFYAFFLTILQIFDNFSHIYQEVKRIITKVVEIKEFWIIKPLTEGNRKDVDGLKPHFMTSIIYFTFDISPSVDSNDFLFTIFFR
jgi:hypothetical protein